MSPKRKIFESADGIAWNKRGADNEQTAPSEISRSASFSLIVPLCSYDPCARSVTGHRSQTTFSMTFFLLIDSKCRSKNKKKEEKSKVKEEKEKNNDDSWSASLGRRSYLCVNFVLCILLEASSSNIFLNFLYSFKFRQITIPISIISYFRLCIVIIRLLM